MTSFKHILFPVDFSPRCRAAQPMVGSWARRFNAKVTLLHAIQIPISSYGGPDGYPIVVDFPVIEASARARLERFEIDASNVTRFVSMGDPAYETIQYAEENSVDLIMMPTHGYGKFRGLLLGSTAAKVLHDAHCPVWTSAHLEEIPVHPPTEVQNILCAIEKDSEAVSVIHWASELAQTWQAKLRLVSAVPADETRPEIYLEGDYRGELIKTRTDEMAKLQLDAKTNFEFTVGAGSPAHVIRDVARETQADLLVTGHGKLHETFGRLRTNTFQIIHDCPCPVLSR